MTQIRTTLTGTINNILLTPRVDKPELLDMGSGSDEEARRSLDDLRRLNRLLFGVHVTLGPLQKWLLETPEPAAVLDLGTGSGQIAQALARWAMRRYRTVRVFALDLTPRHLTYAHQWNTAMSTPHVHLVAGDALHLPFADGSVDYVTSSLFLHHFDKARLLQLLTECRRVARRGIVMSDLWRHPLPYYLYKGLVEPLLVRSPITQADSTTSFHRSYRPAEIEQIASQLLPDVNVRLHFPSFRWLLTSRWNITQG
ncbi:MAG: methyltransferase domain-containing protein [Chloroflexota bacterium]|nr:methyltransferase domain-containing protein [Chloroflexota bacterium]